ncbi:MAG: glycosyltransferase family 4 protein [Solirubrobacterales bacterium]
MRVAYLSHTGLVSGAERSLLAILAELPDSVSPRVISPPGPFRRQVEELGIPTTEVRGMEAGLRMHPVHAARAAGQLVSSALEVRRFCARERIELVHANSIRAGLIAAMARRLGAPPALVTIHDCLPPGRSAALISRVIRRQSAVVVANSRYTADSFGGAHVRVIHPAVRLEPPPRRSMGAELRAELGIPADTFVAAVVAQITPWKGQETAIRAMARVVRELPEAALLLAGEAKFVGSSRRYDNVAYLEHLRSLTDRLGLSGAVRFLGEREDVSAIVSAADVLLAPSWEEPFGMAIVEAMLAGTPPIATSIGGPPEIIDDGRSGVIVEPRRAEPWAEAILRLAGDAATRESMGQAASQAALRYSPKSRVAQTLTAYEVALRG